MRALATVLLVANLLFFAFSRGWLDDVTGLRARGDREPERLARQVRPEAVQVLTPAAAAARAAPTATPAATSSAASPAGAMASQAASTAAASAGGAASAGAPAASAGAAATAASSTGAATAAASSTAAPGAASATRLAAGPAVVCLEAGPFDAATFAGAQTAVRQLLPTVRWADVPTAAVGGSWIVYMGAYANREAQARKEDELRRIKVGFEEVTAPPALQQGLSLGRFDSRSAAEAALARFTQRGIRTARVVETVPPVPAHRLRVEPLDEAQAAALLALPAAGTARRFVPCAAG